MSFKTTFWGGLLAYLVGKIVYSIIFLIIIIAIIGGIFSSLSEDKDQVSISEPVFLKLHLQGNIAERKNNNPIQTIIAGDQNTAPSLEEIKEGLTYAKQDPLVKGVLLDFSGLSSGIANIEELRNELINFKKSGKKVYSYSNGYSQSEYFLASCADSIWLNPQGGIEFKGLSMKYLFFKNLLAKLGVKPEIFRQGKYKSAIEPFELDSMSAASEEQSSVLIHSIWNDVLTKISKSRKSNIAALNHIADSLVLLNAHQALENHLIDGIYYRDQVEAQIVKASSKKQPLVAFSAYLKTKTPIELENSENKKSGIAVLYAEGEIVDGKGGKEQIGDVTFMSELKKIREDSSIKALVIRINSPGGSAQASENILREIELIKKIKPVVISMGNVAASGGYYIACKSDAIVAQPNTITGSIGVFGMMFNMRELFEDKIGVTFDGVQTNKHSDFPAINREISAKEKEIIQKEIALVYGVFKERVAKGRNITIEMADSLGRGRVWSGIDAKRIGLVDALGGLDDAIAIAAQKAKLKNYEIKSFPKQEFNLAEAVKDISSLEIQKTISESAELKTHYSAIMNLLRQMQSMKGIQTRLPGEIIIE
ncbi:MAG: signal peptide peptidase SppA [Bacteroidetes bacterium]|nr:signal peptide peptidase SppA [Bacteroidota bacterium]